MEDFDRILVSGSKTSASESAPWIDQLLEFIRRAADFKIPFLGVCFGHQMLARAFGGVGSVRKAKSPEFGWVEIQTEATSPLMAGLPVRFHSFAAHFDEVGELPSGFKVLARSEVCAIQACQLSDLPIYGIQFHPEKTWETAEKLLIDREKFGEPVPFLNRKQGRLLYKDEIADRIFNNFLSGGLE